MWVNLKSGRRVEITTMLERPDIDVGPWPTFMRHNRVAEAFFWQIPQVFPELCLVGTDEHARSLPTLRRSASSLGVNFLPAGGRPQSCKRSVTDAAVPTPTRPAP